MQAVNGAAGGGAAVAETMRTVEDAGGGARTVTVSPLFAEIYNGDEYDDETDDNNND